jgi:glycyl-tRNA synthetase
MEKSGVDLMYTDPQTNEKFIPHVIEPTFGISRAFLALLSESYTEEGDRVILKLHKKLAPYKAAVFPLVRNKPELVEKARGIFEGFLKKGISVAWDDRGNIGKRYLTQDEIGTPSCITVDYQTLDDDTVTVRDRDSMKQVRVNINELDSSL